MTRLICLKQARGFSVLLLCCTLCVCNTSDQSPATQNWHQQQQGTKPPNSPLLLSSRACKKKNWRAQGSFKHMQSLVCLFVCLFSSLLSRKDSSWWKHKAAMLDGKVIKSGTTACSPREGSAGLPAFYTTEKFFIVVLFLKGCEPKTQFKLLWVNTWG